MTTYANVVGRADSAALVPEEQSSAMMGLIRNQSAAFQMFRRVPVTTAEARFPILSALPTAYWVSGDTGLTQTTEQQWTNKFINIEVMAVIVPMPLSVVADVSDAGGFDLWEEIQPTLTEAAARLLDDSIFFGVNAPGTFPTCIKADAENRGFEHTEGSEDGASEGGIQNDIDICIGQTEIVGFDPSGIVARRTLKGKLRRARSTIGERLTGVNPEITEYMGMPIAYPMRGLFPTGDPSVEAFIGDFSEYFLGIRQEFEWQLFKEGVITNSSGEVVVNLMQEKMAALMLSMRCGWQVSNKMRYDKENESERYPVAVLKATS